MLENKFHVTDAQLQDILRNENFGIECDETNDTSIHAIVSDLVSLRERNKTAERIAKIEVLEEILNTYESVISDSKTLQSVFHDMLDQLKAGN